MDNLKEEFKECFEEHTGWDPADYPDKQYVEDLWKLFQRGFEVGLGAS